MLYYQVKPEADQRKASIRFKNDFLVAGELYTQREIERAEDKGEINEAFILNFFDRKEIPRGRVYFVFGSRRGSV